MGNAIGGIHVVGTIAVADDIQNRVSREGIHVWRVDVSKIDSRADLFDAIGRALSFPSYYGHNWDALEECLRDFEEGKGWLIIFDNAERLLILPKRDLTTLKIILSDTASFWSAESRTFGALFVGGANLSDALGVSACYP